MYIYVYIYMILFWKLSDSTLMIVNGLWEIRAHGAVCSHSPALAWARGLQWGRAWQVQAAYSTLKSWSFHRPCSWRSRKHGDLWNVHVCPDTQAQAFIPGPEGSLFPDVFTSCACCHCSSFQSKTASRRGWEREADGICPQHWVRAAT